MIYEISDKRLILQFALMSFHNNDKGKCRFEITLIEIRIIILYYAVDLYFIK